MLIELILCCDIIETKNFQLVTFSLERVGGGEEGACQFGAKLEGCEQMLGRLREQEE
ncbi:11653_t:CDS:2 [Entrophospora sp. SA101]|nr:11653_t:CDS:2 [Entrophospora sp. SA101]CAJ0914916.1 18353_t:CDS:2 [Entrophospora sp. SA101]